MTAPPPSPPHDAPTGWMSALARVMARVTANADREGVLTTITSGLVEEFGVALARLWLYYPADDTLHLRASAGIPDEHLGGLEHLPLTETRAPVVQVVLRRETVVIDHHQVHEPLGDGTAFVSPQRPDSNYPFRPLAAVGVTYHLVRALLGDERAATYLPYVALGTVADVVPLVGENRVLVARQQAGQAGLEVSQGRGAGR